MYLTAQWRVYVCALCVSVRVCEYRFLSRSSFLLNIVFLTILNEWNSKERKSYTVDNPWHLPPFPLQHNMFNFQMMSKKIIHKEVVLCLQIRQLVPFTQYRFSTLTYKDRNLLGHAFSIRTRGCSGEMTQNFQRMEPVRLNNGSIKMVSNTIQVLNFGMKNFWQICFAWH